MTPVAGAGGGLARSRRSIAVLALLLALFAAHRLYLILALPFGNDISSDEAIGAVMALRILRGDVWHTFWYGQSYLGSHEPFVVAASFAIFGPSPRAFRAGLLLFAGIFVVSQYAVARRLWGDEGTAVLSTLLAIFPPALFAEYGLRGAYAALAMFAGLLLLSFVAAWRGWGQRGSEWRLFLFGLVGGLGFWANFMVAAYLVPLACALLYRMGTARTGSGWRHGGAALGGFVLGASPVLVYNIRYPLHSLMVSLGFLLGSGGREELSRVGLSGTLSQFVGTLPVDLGLGNFLRASLRPWEGHGALARTLGAVATGGILALAGAAFLPGSRARPPLPKPAIAYGGIGLMVFLFFSVLGGRVDRYLFGALPLICLAGGLAAQRLGTRIAIPAIVAIVLFDAWATVEGLAGRPDAGWPALVARLRERSLRAGYGDHQSQWPILFYSREGIIVSPLAGPVFASRDRGYVDRVDRERDVFYLYAWSSPLAGALEGFLGRRGIGYRKEEIEGYLLYHRFTERFYPLDYLPRDLVPEYHRALEWERRRREFSLPRLLGWKIDPSGVGHPGGAAIVPPEGILEAEGRIGGPPAVLRQFRSKGRRPWSRDPS